MKIKRKDLQRLIESYLFEKVQIPSKVKAKGYTYELPGDGVIKITAKGSKSKNIIILPKDAKEYNGKPLTKSMERNKKFYQPIKGDIVGAEPKAEEYFKVQDNQKVDDKSSSDAEREKIDYLKNKFDEGVTHFLSSLMYGIDSKYGLSQSMIKILTDGDNMIKSKNVSFKDKEGNPIGGRKRKAILNPFFGAKSEPNRPAKEAYKELLQNLAINIQVGDLTNINHDVTVAPYIEKLGLDDPDKQSMIITTRQAVAKISSVGKSLELGDGGENYKDVEKFSVGELSSSFFPRQDFK